MTLTSKDLFKLKNAHPDLVKVVLCCAADGAVSFAVLETVRSLKQQEQNIKNGVSWTKKSRHLPSKDGLSRAVDLVPLVNGKLTFAWPPFYPLAAAMKAAAKSVNVPIEWGGDWLKNKDGPHFQLPWGNKYP